MNSKKITYLSLGSTLFLTGHGCSSTPTLDMAEAERGMSFQQVIARNKGNVSECLTNHRRPNTPIPQGSEIVYEITTGGLGGVMDAELESSRLGQPAVEECIRKTFLSLKFPGNTHETMRYTVNVQQY